MNLELKTKIETTLEKYAEEYSLEKYPLAHRAHLGASVIGEECWRKLWFNFRWVKLEQFDARMRRLFQRGHLEESRFEDFLLWAGIKIQSINPETNKQYLFSTVQNHYGGSTDGIGLITWADNLPVILEYKTHNKRLFTELKKYGLQKAQPKHFAQMCAYGKEFKVEYGLYFAINKDDDAWHREFVKLDWNYAIELQKKATDIIYSKNPPNRIADNPAFDKCKYCHYSDICFNNAPVEINCRSCKYAEPINEGHWKCNFYNDLIPKPFMPKGCPQHISIMS